jgi:preprotein translocase subunit SecA
MTRPLPHRLRRWLRWPVWPWLRGADLRRGDDGPFLRAIALRASVWARLSDNGLADGVRPLRQSLEARQSLEGRQVHQSASQSRLADDSQVADLFAAVGEALWRQCGLRFYEVQMLAGRALVGRAIAEMRTGEGKTFTTLLPAAWLALAGGGVHVMTVNAYLAERDHALLAPVLARLGLTAGLLRAQATPSEKRAAYACDVTFGPGYEYGFDYLRDQTSHQEAHGRSLGDSLRQRRRGHATIPGQFPSTEGRLQRGHAAAIVDEADSVMIDEATTPLILAAANAGPAPNAATFRAALAVATQLVLSRDFVVDKAAGFAALTSEGERRLATLGPPANARLERPWTRYIEQALAAEHLFRRDVHYVVVDAELRIVDGGTGRIFTDRTWQDGLHQALQAKEDIPITAETRSLARITRQRYLGLYGHLCGMTGTAREAEDELAAIYKLETAVIPTHRPPLGKIQPARVFHSQESKEQAIVEDTVRLHQTGRPVLVGAATIEASERLAAQLARSGLAVRLLNGRQDEEEAAVIAQAGRAGAITVATNMAGRGTDIKLDPAALQAGGLHVIVAELQESARVDRQLIGRAARQGDPGSAQRFLAATDSLLVRHDRTLAREIAKIPVNSHGEWTGTAARRFIHRLDALQRKIDGARRRQREELFRQDDWREEILRDLA